MGNDAAGAAYMKGSPITVEQSVAGIQKVVDETKREEKVPFISFDGTRGEW